jgi:hypothetical protein
VVLFIHLLPLSPSFRLTFTFAKLPIGVVKAVKDVETAVWFKRVVGIGRKPARASRDPETPLQVFGEVIIKTVFKVSRSAMGKQYLRVSFSH